MKLACMLLIAVCQILAQPTSSPGQQDLSGEILYELRGNSKKLDVCSENAKKLDTSLEISEELNTSYLENSKKSNTSYMEILKKLDTSLENTKALNASYLENSKKLDICLENSKVVNSSYSEILKKLNTSYFDILRKLDTYLQNSKDLDICSEKLNSCVENITSYEEAQTTPGYQGTQGKPCDCLDLQKAGSNRSDVYTVYAPQNSTTPIRVYCDMATDGGGWLVFQRRTTGTEHFYRDWLDYKHGFGNLTNAFWLGNENLFQILNSCGNRHEMRIELKNAQGVARFAKYSTFNIANEDDMYRLLVGGYHGDAGDALIYHNRYRFTTYDRDNDASSDNCAVSSTGAWWYNSCYLSNLNGNINLRWESFDRN